VISDALSQAEREVEQYLIEMPDTYKGPRRRRLINLLIEMKSIRLLPGYDSLPDTSDESYTALVDANIAELHARLKGNSNPATGLSLSDVPSGPPLGRPSLDGMKEGMESAAKKHTAQ
jgi:hypothetical protein